MSLKLYNKTKNNEEGIRFLRIGWIWRDWDYVGQNYIYLFFYFFTNVVSSCINMVSSGSDKSAKLKFTIIKLIMLKKTLTRRRCLPFRFNFIFGAFVSLRWKIEWFIHYAKSFVHFGLWWIEEIALKII